ncbi:MAG: alpha/beta hydrolase [Proteobacteria bacterium]|nr:alpha/beta hydrolase [Pseudomonadota bacterium]
MPITVQFATNRALTGPAERLESYSADIVPPTDPAAVTYATAFVADADLTADTVGAITTIQNVASGGFSAQAAGDLADPGRNLLVFIHGFANSFENAITRAAFNTQWLSGANIPGSDTTVVAFTWPSLGKVLSFPVPTADYQSDQVMAGQSGPHLMRFFANLLPLVQAARAKGRRTTLIAHSMGNWALQAGVESWFAHGNGPAALFDEAVLAAADERADSFGFPRNGRLSGLSRLAGHISVYRSSSDRVLDVSRIINGIERLGQRGPDKGSDPTLFPPSIYRLADCSAFRDFDFNFASSHQYYRRSPGVRDDIAAAVAGTRRAGA